MLYEFEGFGGGKFGGGGASGKFGGGQTGGSGASGSWGSGNDKGKDKPKPAIVPPVNPAPPQKPAVPGYPGWARLAAEAGWPMEKINYYRAIFNGANGKVMSDAVTAYVQKGLQQSTNGGDPNTWAKDAKQAYIDIKPFSKENWMKKQQQVAESQFRKVVHEYILEALKNKGII